MSKQFIISFFLISLGTFLCRPGLKAQSDCEKVLLAAENLYQSGQLYDIPEKLLPCLEKGFNYVEKQSAYRLLALTYLNINQEEEAKKVFHKLLKLNPDYLVTKEKDPVELYNLYLQFNVDPVFYVGLRGGGLVTQPFILHYRSSSSLAFRSDKSYNPYYGFQFGTDFAIPVVKNMLLEFNPSYARSTYSFSSLYLTDAFSEGSEAPQVQEVTGQETYNNVVLPFILNFRFPSRKNKLYYNVGVGAGASFLLSSSYNDLNRINKQIFTEEISLERVYTTSFRRNTNVQGYLELGIEYKYLGYFWGARTGLSSTILNFTKYPNQQERYLNTMSTSFGWLDDDFVLTNGYLSVFIRKPIYNFLKASKP